MKKNRRRYSLVWPHVKDGKVVVPVISEHHKDRPHGPAAMTPDEALTLAEHLIREAQFAIRWPA